MISARRRRVAVALALNVASLLLAVWALASSYWCEGTRKVVKPFCSGPGTTKQWFCIRFNSSDLNDSRLVQYIWETGDDKYLLRKFHTGIWLSCEQNANMTGEKCRRFLYVAPSNERGVLLLCIVAEVLYIVLLTLGGVLMSLEICHFGNVINRLKINAYAAVFTVLSGLLGMTAHMMFTTAFQLTVRLGPEDWKPQTWDYSWSYILAWSSFTACMASAVTTINRYTKTILEFKHKRRNIEKSLRIKQTLLELDSPDQVWHGGPRPEALPDQVWPVGLRPEALPDQVWPVGLRPEALPDLDSPDQVWHVGSRPEALPDQVWQVGSRPEALPDQVWPVGSRPETLPDLDCPDQVWHVGSRPETLPDLSPDKHTMSKLTETAFFLDLNDLTDSQREEYC